MKQLITIPFATGYVFALALFKERSSQAQYAYKCPLIQCLTKDTQWYYIPEEI